MDNGSGQNFGSVLAKAAGAGVSAIPGAMAQERQQTLENIMTTMQFQGQLAAQQRQQEQMEIAQKRLEIAQAAENRAVGSYQTPVQIREQNRQIAEENAARALTLQKGQFDLDQQQKLEILQGLTGQTTRNLGPILGPGAFTEVPLGIGELGAIAAEKFPTLDFNLGGGMTVQGMNPGDLTPPTKSVSPNVMVREFSNDKREFFNDSDGDYQIAVRHNERVRSRIDLLSGTLNPEDLEKRIAKEGLVEKDLPEYPHTFESFSDQFMKKTPTPVTQGGAVPYWKTLGAESADAAIADLNDALRTREITPEDYTLFLNRLKGE